MSIQDFDPFLMRARINNVTKSASDALPWPEGLEESTFQATSLDGSTFNVHRFVPKLVIETASTTVRAIVFAFGGGMVAGNVEVFRGFIATLAEMSGTQVFAPEWRIAPENPYPAGVEDVYSTTVWLQSKATEFSVDPARIVLFGISAGGAVSAGAALMARDKGLSPPPAGLCLRYPMLDDQAYLDKTSPRYEKLGFSNGVNDFCWKTYMGGLEKWERNDDNTPAYASPSRNKNFSNLPPTHIAVCDFDLFREENIKFAFDLGNAPTGAGVELRVYPGVPHGFDGTPSRLRDEMWENEARFIRKL